MKRNDARPDDDARVGGNRSSVNADEQQQPITEIKETLRAEIAAGFARMLSEIQSLKADLKIHELEHHHK